MTKETVRYPDTVVESVEQAVDEDVFESKSEFYRFSAEYVLHSILDDYGPETFDFEEIVADLNDQHDFEERPPRVEGDGAFLEALLTVRKHGMRGEVEDAAAFIDDTYDRGDIESVILEELLRQYRDDDTA